MKSVMLLLFVLTQFICGQVPNQPEYLGLTIPATYWRYAILFEEGGGRYYFTCTHSQPLIGEDMVGQEITFGNGEKSRVKRTFNISGGYYRSEYDITIGELETPVSAKPIKVWWSTPKDFVQDQITITGFGIDGFFTGTDGHLYENHPTEIYNGIAYNASPGLIRPGYSGAPILYQGKLLGVNWGSWGGNPSLGGWFNLISQVFEKYKNNFPDFLQSPQTPSLVITPVDGYMEITLKCPSNLVYDVMYKSDISRVDLRWRLMKNNTRYLGEDPCGSPWGPRYKWNHIGTQRMFFQAIRVP